MTVQTMSRFFAFLSLVSFAGAALVAVVAVAARGDGAPPWVRGLRADLGRAALGLAATVAVVTTLGSLYYSEVQTFTPCKLCWIQRICMYPLAILLSIAAVRRDAAIRIYALPLCVIGIGFSLYHTRLQAWPEVGSGFCSLEAPCTDRHVWELGFVSLPFMALSAFTVIATLLLVARPTQPNDPVELDEGDLEEIPA